MDKYMLRVRAGPTKTNLTTIHVNEEFTPVLIDSDFFSGYLVVRSRDFTGVTPQLESNLPHSPIPNPASYFEGKNRRYSMCLQGRFKHSWGGDDLIFGVDMDVPLRSPIGTSIGLKVAKWLDPALEADISCDKPYIFSPVVSAMNSLAVYDRTAVEIRDTSERTERDNIVILGMESAEMVNEMTQTNGNTKSSITQTDDVKSSVSQDRDNNESQDNGENHEGRNSNGTTLASQDSNGKNFEGVESNGKTIEGIDSNGKTLEGLDSNGTTHDSNGKTIETQQNTLDKKLLKHNKTLQEFEEKIGVWSFHTSLVQESTALLLPNDPNPGHDKRKKLFSSLATRQSAHFRPDLVYCFDFYDAYFDFGTCSVKLPGFSLNCSKYWDGQHMRYSATTRDRKTVFFVVQFELVLKSDYGLE